MAERDGRYLSTEVGGGFTGRVIGRYGTEGSAAFDWFDYAPTGAGGVPPGRGTWRGRRELAVGNGGAERGVEG